MFNLLTLQPVEVVAQALGVSVSADNNNLCVGEHATITATPSGGTPPYTYLWSTSETTNQIVVNPTSSTTYTVTVTDNAFATVTDSEVITVNTDDDCCVPSARTVYTNATDLLTDYATLPGEISNETDDILLGGTGTPPVFNVDIDLAFISCPNIFIKPEVQLVLAAGVTLRIHDTHIRAGCNTLWHGIIATNNNDAVIIGDASIVQDAHTAVFSTDGGDVQVIGSTMRNNYIHVELGDASYPSTGTKFHTSSFERDNYLLYPRQNEITLNGIVTHDVTDLQIGNPTNVAYRNTFLRFSNNGIRLRDTDAEIYNNDFTGGAVTTGWSALMAGSIGIYATGDNSATYTATIGGNGSNQLNRFYSTNLRRGIYATNGMTMNIVNNQFQNKGDGTIDIESGRVAITVTNNFIEDGGIGIRVNNTSNNTEVLIASNSIDKQGNGTGIAVTNTTLFANLDVRISQNEIQDVRTGIQLTNLDQAFVNENHIEFGNATTAPSTGYVKGISLTGCEHCIIQDNQITDVATSVPRNKFFGIYVEDFSDHSTLCSNSMVDMIRGIVYDGVNEDNEVITNNIDGANYGFTIANGGEAGPQGKCTGPSGCPPADDATDEGDPFGNVFLNIGNSDLRAENFSDGRYTPFAENGGLSSTSISSSLSIVVLPETSASIPNCPGNPHSFRLAGALEAEQGSAILVDRLLSSWQNFNSLLNQNPGDEQLQHILWLREFHLCRKAARAEVSPESINGFTPGTGSCALGLADAALEQSIQTGNGITAVTNSLGAFSPENKLDSVFHYVLSVNAAFLASGDSSYLKTQTSKLREIAGYCHERFGRAATIAGVLLTLATGEDWQPVYCSLEDSGNGANRLSKVQSGMSVAVFPNPADRAVQIRIVTPEEVADAGLVITDLSGREVFRARLIGTAPQAASTALWPQGLYLYRIVSDNGLTTTGKLLINH